MVLLATALTLLVVACVRVVAPTGRGVALSTLVAVAVPVLLAAVYDGYDGVTWYWHAIWLIDLALPLTLVTCALIAVGPGPRLVAEPPSPA